MELKPIKSNKQYKAYLEWVDTLFDKKVKPSSPEGKKLQVALLLIKQYEDEHFPIPTPDTLEALLLKGPTATKKQLDTIAKNQKAINQWRTK